MYEYSLPVCNGKGSVVDRHRFDANPDQTSHYAPDPAPSFTDCGKSHSIASLNCLIFVNFIGVISFNILHRIFTVLKFLEKSIV
jgi:hypothetical protein